MFKRLLLSVSIGLFSVHSYADNLLQVYENAMNYDASLKAANSELDTSKDNVPLARAALLPAFGIQGQLYKTNVDITTANYNSNYTGANYALKLEQPLYDPQKMDTYEISKMAYNAAESKFGDVKQKTGFKVAQAYFNVLKYKNNLKVAEEKFKTFQSQYDKIEKEYKLGGANLLNLNEIKSALDLAKVNKISAQSNLTDAKENLNKMTGRYYESLDDIDNNEVISNSTKTLSEWENKAISNNLTLTMLRKYKKIAHKKIDVAKSEYLPKLNLFASYEHLDRNNDFNLEGGNRNTMAYGVEIKYPLFTGGSTTYKIRKANDNEEKVQNQYDNALREVNVEVNKSYQNLRLIKEMIDAKKEALKSAKDDLSATQKGYQLGKRNFQDILNAQEKYYDAQASYVNSKYDYISQYLFLEYLTGNINKKTINKVNDWLL